MVESCVELNRPVEWRCYMCFSPRIQVRGLVVEGLNPIGVYNPSLFDRELLRSFNWPRNPVYREPGAEGMRSQGGLATRSKLPKLTLHISYLGSRKCNPRDGVIGVEVDFGRRLWLCIASIGVTDAG